MRPVTFAAAVVADTLKRLGVATVPQLVDALGGPSHGTVFRKLRQLDTLSSYSHCGQYHALRSSARFDEHGLWAHGDVRFSARGTLRATVAALTEEAPRGWLTPELDALVGVSSLGALRGLVQAGKLACVRVDGHPLYCSADPDRQQRQVDARRGTGQPLEEPVASPAQVAAAVYRFTGLLDERQRRLFAGLISLASGHGGDKYAAAWVGLHPKTVSKGRRELVRGKLAPGRVRRPGGGRKPSANKT